jgi:lipopolysaccharide transport system permease protein
VKATASATPVGPVSRPVLVAPRRGWVGIDARELWSFRDLLYFLVWRDLKIRYRQTAFGAAWAILQPAAMTIVFVLVLGRVGGIAPPEIPYPIFVLAGLVPWTLYAQGISSASSSLVSAAGLIQKVYFPRLLLPTASVLSFLPDLLIAFGLLLVAVLAFGTAIAPTVILVLPLAVLAVAQILAFSIWLAAINVRYRDVRYAVPFVLQLWLLASPIAYSLASLPPAWRPIYSINPVVGVVEGIRWAVFGVGNAPIAELSMSLALTAIVLIAALLYFRRVERTFADVI